MYKTCYYLTPMCHITQWKWLPSHEEEKIRGTSLWDVLQHILQQLSTDWHQNIFQNHWNIYNKTNIFHPYAISQNERDYQILKNPRDVLMRRPATHFNRLTLIYLPRFLIYIQNTLSFVIHVLYHTRKVIAKSWKNPR